MMVIGCLVAGVPEAVVPFPMTLAVIVLLITGTSVADAIPVLTATLAAHCISKDVILENPKLVGQGLRDIDAALQEAEEVSPEALASR